MVEPDAVTPPPGAEEASLVDALHRVRARLVDLALPLDAPGAQAARADRAAALAQLDDYLLPRLRAVDAPLLVVVGGSTGAGKSTLVNSLLGARVTEPGVLRPTTRAPVLVHHPLDGRWFLGDRVLPGMARLTSGASGAESGAVRAGGAAPGPASVARAAPGAASATTSGAAAVRLVAAGALPRGLALLDAPDIDSVEVANRALAAQLLAAADLWLFVTTAARYADAVPWDLLHDAAARHAQVALVVDRVDPGSEAAVADLRRMMDDNGLAGAPLFAVPEGLDPDGLLPEDAVGELAAWLTALGGDAGARREVALRTRDGVVDDLARRAAALGAAADLQVATAGRLREAVTRAYEHAGVEVRAATSDGAMLRGEVLARWQELVGTGDLLRAVEQRVGRLRDRVTGLLRGRPAPVPPVEQAIAHGLAAVLLDAADSAAERSHAAWRADLAGRALLDGLDLSRASTALRGDVGRQIRAWQSDVLDLVREQGGQRRGTARALSFGVNALGVSLMVLAFASTGGLTGIEVGIAGGTAVVAQKLLEAVFGDDAVRRLTATARERLDVRVRAVLEAEAARYTAQLDALGVSGGEGVRSVAAELVAAARAERAARVGRRGADAGPSAGADPSADAGRSADAHLPPGAGRSADPRPSADAPSSDAGALRGATGRRAGPGAVPPHDRGGVVLATGAEAPARRGFWRRLLGRGDAG